MPLNNIGALPVSSADGLKSAARTPMQDLDKEAFLKLLIAQLSNQDPLKPMEDKEFIAQMAQFSTLEQMTNMSKTLEKIANADKFSAVSYVGKTIAFTQGEDPEGNPLQVAAEVLAVWFDPQKGTLLETSKGDVLLKDVEGVGPALSSVRPKP